MTAATIAKIGAGTTLSYEDSNTPGTFIDLVNALQVGSTGEQGEFVEITPISQTTRQYIPGMKTPPDKEITFNDVPGDTDQEAFFNLAKSAETVNMQIIFANGRKGAYALALSGYQVNEPEGNSQITITVYGKQSGSVTWTTS